MDTNSQDVSITELITLLLSRWRIIVLVTISITTLALLVAFLSRPVYVSQVLVSPVDESADAGLGALASQFGGVASLAGIDLGGAGTKKEEAIAILRSRDFTVDFINSNKLMPILFEDDWDAANDAWLEADVAKQPSEWDAYKLFNEEVRNIVEDRNSGLVTVQIFWHDPVIAEQWANKLVQGANDVIRNDAIDEAKRSIEYLERELENTSVVEVRNGIFELIEKQVSAAMLANVREEYAFKILDPAVVSDADDFEEPRRPLIVIIGVFVGGFLGIVLALFREFLSARKRRAA